MDDSLKELESELHNLTPQAPRAACVERLAAELRGADVAAPAAVAGRRRYRTATSWTSWKWANWTVAAALVGLLAVATLIEPPAGHLDQRPATAVASVDLADELRPVRAGRTWVDSRTEGVIELPDGSPVERVRDYFVDTIEWQDDAGRAQLRWEVPRESVRFVALASY